MRRSGPRGNPVRRNRGRGLGVGNLNERGVSQDESEYELHAIFTPGYDGWLEQIDHAIKDLKPDSMKGYTIGDNTNKNLSKHPWRLDDEKLVYPAYEKFTKAGLKNVCVHKGLFPPSVEKQFPHLLEYSDVRDVGKAAKDWPQLNFIIYHGGYRFAGGGSVEDACVMTFAYWNPRVLKQDHLVNFQTGVWTPVTVHTLGKEQIEVRGSSVTANHFRIDTERNRIEVWYSPEGEWIGLRSTTRTGHVLEYRLR